MGGVLVLKSYSHTPCENNGYAILDAGKITFAYLEKLNNMFEKSKPGENRGRKAMDLK